MDPVLATQYPIHKIGSDGFSWWVGQIESGPNDDPKKSGRYRVRIVGTHLKDCNSTPTNQLPWANVMLPATTPWSDGGVTGASIGLNVGNWVVGFYLDNDKQKPLIMGSVGHTAGATLLENVEEDPSPESSCKSFATFLSPDRDPYLHEPLPEKEKRDSTSTDDNGGATKVGQAGKIAAAVPDKMPAVFYALFAEANANNPTGAKVCVEIANPSCGSENDLQQGLKNIIADMLAANQSSGGQLGSYYVGKFNGELNSYINNGKQYVNKAIRLVKSFIARLKGEIVKLIKEGVDKLIEAILYTEVAAKDALGNVNTGPVNPDLGVAPFQPITQKQSVLKPVIDTINDVLAEIGCSMEDLTEKISKYITDLLLGFLMDAYRQAACLVDTLVNGIINQLLEFIESTLASILGPLQDILSIIANPANLIGGIIKKAFDLLGISCDGPKASCEKVIKKCTDCGDGTTDDQDWLDDLIDQLEDGPLDSNQYVCDEAKKPPEVIFTSITFVGGVPAAVQTSTTDTPGGPGGTTVVPTTKLIQYTSSDVTVREGEDAEFVFTRSGDTTVSSSIRIQIIPKTAKLDVDFQKAYEGSVIGFGKGETEKRILFRTFRDNESEGSENFFIRIESRVKPEGYAVNFPSGRDFECTIVDTNSIPSVDPGTSTLTPYVPPSTTLPPSIVFTPPNSQIIPLIPRYVVKAEKPFYYETETVVFNVYGKNVSPGDVITWSIDIDPEDVVGGLTSGTATINDDLEATITFELAENNDNFRVDAPGTVPQTDEDGNFILDEDGNVTYNTEEIITDFDDLNELLTLTIEDTGDNGSTTIVGENDLTPSYFVRASQTSYNEGDTMVFYVYTTNVPDGTELCYTLSGDISADDIDDKKLQKCFIINGGKAQIDIVLAEDNVIEDSQLVTLSIDDTDASENVIINPEFSLEIPEPTPTYSVSTDKLEYMEGEVIKYTITTTNVPDGTVLQWILTGSNITPSDFIGGKTFGRVVIIDNEAVVFVSIAEDSEIENNETLRFLLSGTNGFAEVIILGNLDEDDPNPTPLIPTSPCLDKPVAGEPITDETGSIISIPIISKGCPYVEPPKVIVTGAGIGASAIPLLDDTGRVSEIRVTRVGGGYRKNTSLDKNLKCIIDSFTLLSPGRGYTSEPSVFVDGKPNIAKAIIDENGFVISVQILDRSLEIVGLPKVTIQGGGGSGARVLPSITCLDTLESLASTGYAKIGTGKYIDCP